MKRLLSIARRWAAIVAGFLGLVPLFFVPPAHTAVLIPIALPFVAAILIHVPRLAPQLLARSAWCSNMVLGVLLAWTERGQRQSVQDAAVTLAVASGAALLLAGRGQIAEAMERSQFAPAAFGNSLLALMILAPANASTFLLLALTDQGPAGEILFAATAVSVAGLVGLFRFRLWAILLNVGVGLVIALRYGLSPLATEQMLAGPVTVLASLQPVVAAPMLLCMALRRRPPELSLRNGALVGGALVIVLMILAFGARSVPRLEPHVRPSFAFFGQEPPVCLPDGSGDRDTSYRGRPVRLDGRVVRVDGTPIEGVRLSVISRENPHRGSGTVAVTTTDATGRFSFEPVPLYGIGHLLVESGGTRHVHGIGRIPEHGPETVSVGDVPFEQDRLLLVTADCNRPISTRGQPSDDRGEGIGVQFEWMGQQLILNQYLLAPDHNRQHGEGVEKPLHPGFDDSGYRPLRSARHFERRLKVPPGTHKVTVSGGCGELETQVEVPAEGEVAPLVLTLPR